MIGGPLIGGSYRDDRGNYTTIAGERFSAPDASPEWRAVIDGWHITSDGSVKRRGTVTWKRGAK